MDEAVPTASVADQPLCVCGYSKVGLPGTDHPCPECGSTKSAVYHGSYSYYGWNVALLGAGISFAHTLFVIVCAGIDFEPPEVLFLVPSFFLVELCLSFMNSSKIFKYLSISSLGRSCCKKSLTMSREDWSARISSSLRFTFATIAKSCINAFKIRSLIL